MSNIQLTEQIDIQIETVAISDTGKMRDKNEDYFGYLSGEFGYLFVICDGMGGAVGGDIASKTAVDTILSHFDSVAKYCVPYKELRAAFSRANSRIRQIASENPVYQGMGSTVVATLVQGDQAVVAHLGDSRIYLLRNKKLYRLTKDHSLVQTLIEKKQLKASKAALHEQRHIITKALGPVANVSAEVSNSIQLYNDDILLLCTDGLITEVPEKDIRSIIKKNSLERAAELLIDAANAYGGLDNITLQLVRISGCSDLPLDYIDKNPLGKPRIKEKVFLWAIYFCIVALLIILAYISFHFFL
jgi:protein phosphatase